MIKGRSACLATIVALGAWSLSACSSDTKAGGTDAGTGEETGGGNGGSAGKGGSGGSAGKAGSSGSSGTAGTAGKGGTGGSAGAKTDAGPGDAGGFVTDGGEPSVTITSPADLAKVGPGAAYPAYPDVPIGFKVGNFALKAPGTLPKDCPLATCGHVHINVDGNACNDTASGFPYNAAGIASPLDIGLDYCKGGIAGAHTVTVSLHDTNHKAITDSKGNAVEASITITAAAESDAGTTDAGGAKTDH